MQGLEALKSIEHGGVIRRFFSKEKWIGYEPTDDSFVISYLWIDKIIDESGPYEHINSDAMEDVIGSVLWHLMFNLDWEKDGDHTLSVE